MEQNYENMILPESGRLLLEALRERKAIEESLLLDALTLIKSHTGEEPCARRSIDLTSALRNIIEVANNHGLLLKEKC
jgi:hypothetical protein